MPYLLSWPTAIRAVAVTRRMAIQENAQMPRLVHSDDGSGGVSSGSDTSRQSPYRASECATGNSGSRRYVLSNLRKEENKNPHDGRKRAEHPKHHVFAGHKRALMGQARLQHRGILRPAILDRGPTPSNLVYFQISVCKKIIDVKLVRSFATNSSRELGGLSCRSNAMSWVGCLRSSPFVFWQL